MSMQQTPAGVIPQWTVADRLRKARIAAGLEQAELARDIDVSRNTVSNYESGHVTPRRIVLRAWSLRTGVPLEWIETGVAPGSGDDPHDGSRSPNYGLIASPVRPWTARRSALSPARVRDAA